VSFKRIFERGRRDEDFSAEIEAHLAHEIDRNVEAGMDADEARYTALRKFGNVTSTRETIHEMNSVGFLESFWQDALHGLRLLRLNPAFTLVATISLALGMGANSAIFQLLNAVRLRTLPVQRPQELAEIRIASSPQGRTGRFTGRHPELTYAVWERLSDRQHSFSTLFAWGSERFNLAEGGEARYAEGLWVSGRFFEGLGIPALRGRVLSDDDDRIGCADPGVAVSYSFWQRELGGAADAVGRILKLEGRPFEIVGITPPGFFGVEVGKSFDVAIPLCAQSLLHPEDETLANRSAWWLAVIGRLDPGVSLEQATADLATISTSLFEETLPPYADANDRRGYLALRLKAIPAASGVSQLRTEYETPLWLLLGASGLVLLIACANIASLLLARATARTREISVRLAIGASRGRVVRQLLAESLLLASIGALGAWFLARASTKILVSFLDTAQNPISLDVETDWASILFLAALAVATCLVFGLVPAIRETRLEPWRAIRSGARSVTASREKLGLRRVLVVAQVALSLVLLFGAALFARSLGNLLSLDSGIREEGLLVTSVDLERLGYPGPRRHEVYRAMLERLRGVPGVEAAAGTFIVPLGGFGWNDNVFPDLSAEKSEEPVISNFNEVTDAYFETLGTPLLAGRDFDGRDSAGAPRVAIVDVSFAERLLGGTERAVGSRFRVKARLPGQAATVFEIVGLVKNAKYESLRKDFTPTVYLPASQQPEALPATNFLLRSRVAIPSLVPAIEAAISEVEPQASLQFQVFEEKTRESLARERMMATLSGFFGLLAGLLAAIGLYGTLSYNVAVRRNEIGIRIALGARRGGVMAMVMKEASILLSIGLGLGAIGSLLLGNAAQSLLFGLDSRDPLTLSAAVAALALVGAAASFVPACRAARVEPRVVLSEE
jgi:putative ABC transport system permease protein